MSSKAGLRYFDRQRVKEIKTSLMGDIQLLKNYPEKFMLRQVIKILKVGDSGTLMEKEKFKAVLKDYVESDKIPEDV